MSRIFGGEFFVLAIYADICAWQTLAAQLLLHFLRHLIAATASDSAAVAAQKTLYFCDSVWQLLGMQGLDLCLTCAPPALGIAAYWTRST